jgi:hypothetical protein
MIDLRNPASGPEGGKSISSSPVSYIFSVSAEEFTAVIGALRHLAASRDQPKSYRCFVATIGNRLIQEHNAALAARQHDHMAGKSRNPSLPLTKR